MKPSVDSGGRPRAWIVVQRVVASVFLGFVLANLGGLALARWLPLDRMSGMIVGTLSTFLIWTAATLWVFAQDSNARVWCGLAAAIALSGSVALFLPWLRGAVS
ncbi:MAG: iron transporter [Myxococcota bacterium]